LTRDPKRLVRSERFHPPVTEIFVPRSEPDDLALLSLAVRPREMEHVDFYTVSVGEAPTPIRKSVGIFGFPGEIARQSVVNPERRWMVLPYFDFPPVACVSGRDMRSLMRADPPYRPNLHVLLRFRDRPIQDDEGYLHDPQGISGGGAWKVSARGPKDLWIPADARLVAVVIAYSRRREVLVATRIKRAWRLLSLWEEREEKTTLTSRLKQ